MSELLDEEGNVYRESFGGQWRRQQGLFGAERDVGLFGSPNLQRNAFGQPVQARNAWGSPIYSDDGRPLYQPAGSGSSEGGGGGWGSGGGGGGGGGGDALAGLLALGLIILSVIAVAAVFTAIFKLIGTIIEGYRGLIERHSRGMLIFHLLVGMACVGGLIWLAGLPLYAQIAGAALVPLTWGWLHLTRRLPLVFMPINCAAIGAALWFAADATRPSWEAGWSRLSVGLPLIANLPVTLAALPMLLWLWSLGARRFPRPFVVLRRLVAGALLWFGLMRLWIDWQPYWATFVAPLPWLFALTGWLILLLPLALWLWRMGQARWPLPFTALNMLLFGGLLGLTAYHTQPAWMDIWRHWMAGLPFASTPILAISLAPVAFWGWGVAVNRWRRWLAIPNALLTGGILWLILDRTRPLWQPFWRIFWGAVPLVFDPALVLLFAPLAIWAWRKGAARYPRLWSAARALLWGCVLWWLTERTRPYWAPAWRQFAGAAAPDPAWVALFSIPAAWVWTRLSRRYPRLFTVLGWGAFTLWLYWLASRFFPLSGLAFRGAIALLPLGIYAWFALLKRRALIALVLAIVPVLGALLLYYFAPDLLQRLIQIASAWLLSQGIPFWMTP